MITLTRESITFLHNFRNRYVSVAEFFELSFDSLYQVIDILELANIREYLNINDDVAIYPYLVLLVAQIEHDNIEIDNHLRLLCNRIDYLIS